MRADKNWLFRAFLEELGRLGYVEGQNLVVERYSAEGRRERHAELAREVVGTHPDVIAAFSGPLALAFKAATTEIPIVANDWRSGRRRGLSKAWLIPAETSQVEHRCWHPTLWEVGRASQRPRAKSSTFFTLHHNDIGKYTNLAWRSEQERSVRALP